MTTQPASLPEDSDKTKGLRFAKVLVWIVYAYFAIAVTVLTLAFFLLLFNASQDAGFTQWVYRSASRVLEPFRGIFPDATADNGSVIDFAVLFAIIVYGIVAMLVHGVIHWIDRKIGEERRQALYLQQQNQQQARQAQHDQVVRQQAVQQQQAQAVQQVPPASPGSQA